MGHELDGEGLRWEARQRLACPLPGGRWHGRGGPGLSEDWEGESSRRTRTPAKRTPRFLTVCRCIAPGIPPRWLRSRKRRDRDEGRKTQRGCQHIDKHPDRINRAPARIVAWPIMFSAAVASQCLFLGICRRCKLSFVTHFYAVARHHATQSYGNATSRSPYYECPIQSKEVWSQWTRCRCCERTTGE